MLRQAGLPLGRSPHGERGLKSIRRAQPVLRTWSLSSRRAWIEIQQPQQPFRRCRRSPHGERGLKYISRDYILQTDRSLSSRRAWIEICLFQSAEHGWQSLSSRRAWIEILEITGRSKRRICRSPHGERGLKFFNPCNPRGLRGSLSSRRAWIEICLLIAWSADWTSLSSRRAWIEIDPVSGTNLMWGGRSPHGERGLK